MGYFVPEVMGVGYNYVEKVLNGDVVLKTVVLLAVLKIIATAMCYSSGNAGGIFGPSLFIGAMMGAAVGSVAHSLFPSVHGGPGRLRAGRHGNCFRGNRPDAAHFRDHDFRDHPRLHHHRSADDLEPDRVLHFLQAPEGADL